MDNRSIAASKKSDASAIGLREAKRLRTKEVIRTVAMDLFEAHGFDQTTIDDIARGALVSPPTVFRYFETKDKLLLLEFYDDVEWLKFAFENNKFRSAFHALAELNEIRISDTIPGSMRERSIRVLLRASSMLDVLSKLEHRYRRVLVTPLKTEFSSQGDGLMKAEITAAMLAGSSLAVIELVVADSQPQQMMRSTFSFIEQTLKPSSSP